MASAEEGSTNLVDNEPTVSESHGETEIAGRAILDDQPCRSIVVGRFSENPTTDEVQTSPTVQTATSPSTLREEEEEEPRTTAADIRPRLRRPNEWNSDEVLAWFQSCKLDDLHRFLLNLHETIDGETLAGMFKLKLRNYESYRARYTSQIKPNENKLLQDFNRFGQLLDTYFIDKYAHRFDVAFSFPGDIRGQVSRIAEKLCTKINTNGEQRIFYDGYHKAELARPNLDLYLQTIYRYQTRLIVVFMCDNYTRKEWCGLESRAIRGLMKTCQSDRIMLLTVDGHIIDGVSDIDGYLDISNENEDFVADAIYSRFKQLDEPLPPSESLPSLPPPSQAFRPPPPPPENRISNMIVDLKNTVLSVSPWIVVIGLLSFILGTRIGR